MFSGSAMRHGNFLGTSAVFLRIPCNLSTAFLSRRGFRGSHSIRPKKPPDFPEGNKKPGRGARFSESAKASCQGLMSVMLLGGSGTRLGSTSSAKSAQHLRACKRLGESDAYEPGVYLCACQSNAKIAASRQTNRGFPQPHEDSDIQTFDSLFQFWIASQGLYPRLVNLR